MIAALRTLACAFAVIAMLLVTDRLAETLATLDRPTTCARNTP